ncbi:MAG: nucleotidyltransferase family protein [Verrucomicrobiota bacterium]|nr:nucleotidyltransferase family protein [Verrucomicrobiota bacterium]
MQALIFAGGKGTRLLPDTATVPKPMLRIAGVPLLEILLRQLARQGFREVVLALGHLPEVVTNFVGDGARFGVHMQTLCENEPLGTAGAIALALPHLGENFLTLNGDLLTTMDFAAFADQHRRLGADVSMAIARRAVRSAFGVIQHDDDLRFLDYFEKQTRFETISLGCYVFRKAAIEALLSQPERIDMPELMLRLRDARADVRCVVQECAWYDIGQPDDYRRAQEWFVQARGEILPGA